MRDILFMGEVLASVTHEMQNVMAIIKESGALTDDILNLNGPPKMRHGDKLAAALANIQEQVSRGRNLMFMLNGFAHAAADYPEECDLRRFARQIGVLAERMVRLKECALELDLDGPALPVRGNALLLMQSVYLGISSVLEPCAAGDRLSISVQSPEDNAAFTVLRISASRGDLLPDISALDPLLAVMRAHCLASRGMLDLYYLSAPEQTPSRNGSAS